MKLGSVFIIVNTMKAVTYLIFALLFSVSTVFGQENQSMPEVIDLCLEPIGDFSGTGKRWAITSCDGREVQIRSGQRIRCHVMGGNASEAKLSSQDGNPLDTITYNMPIPGGNVVVVWPHGASFEFTPGTKHELSDFFQNDIILVPGIDKLNASIYPNPVSGSSVHLQDHQSISHVAVMDAQGGTMIVGEVDSNGNLNVEKLKPGVYFITIVYSDGRKVTLKIVIE